MSLFQKISKGRVKKPLFFGLYSGPGLGKTTFAASFPDPFFFDFEESTHNLDVMRRDPMPKEFEEVISDLEEILDEEKITDFKTIVFDTIDELERLIHKDVAESKNKESIDDIGWQKGFDIALNRWSQIISLCRQIRDKHQIHFIFLAHAMEGSRANVEKGVTYSRYKMAIHKKAHEFIFGQLEMVLFAKKDIALKTIDDKTVAVDVEKRLLHTQLSAHYDAKNRIGLAPTLEMPSKGGFDLLWRAYEKAFNETPEAVLKECLEEIEKVKDEKQKKIMTDFCNKHKKDLPSLRIALNRIKQHQGDK
tara:strand:- start:14971 stop:15888 length:918 start_codon:yes stop_codon:yes gene_type:complete